VTARLVLVACLLLAPGLAPAQSTQEIFHIERSKNKNVVRYDARLDKDGQLDAKEPVASYWLGPTGKRWPVKTFDRTFFYGFRVRKDKSGEFWHFSIAAAKGRQMKLYLKDGVPRAEGRVAGTTVYLTKFYVRFAEDTTIPKVLYVDLFGVDVKTGDKRHERFVP
jgi:hypothetical protein